MKFKHFAGFHRKEIVLNTYNGYDNNGFPYFLERMKHFINKAYKLLYKTGKCIIGCAKNTALLTVCGSIWTKNN